MLLSPLYRMASHMLSHMPVNDVIAETSATKSRDSLL